MSALYLSYLVARENIKWALAQKRKIYSPLSILLAIYNSSLSRKIDFSVKKSRFRYQKVDFSVKNRFLSKNRWFWGAPLSCYWKCSARFHKTPSNKPNLILVPQF